LVSPSNTNMMAFITIFIINCMFCSLANATEQQK
jgi:hypothetical protein